MNKYEKALNRIKESYDAFYFENKWGVVTHKKEFELLSELTGDYVLNALGWIANEYDCYYKDEFEDETDTAFGYLRGLIKDE